MKKAKAAFLLWPLLFCTAIYAETSPVGTFSKIAPKGQTKVAAILNGASIYIRLTTHEIDIGKPSDGRPDKLTSSCTYSRYPCSAVDSLELSVNGNNLFVPRSIFADLADINTARLAHERSSFVLILDGGDASESYTVKIIFNGKMIKKRVMTSNETKELIQKTVYF